MNKDNGQLADAQFQATVVLNIVLHAMQDEANAPAVDAALIGAISRLDGFSVIEAIKALDRLSGERLAKPAARLREILEKAQ